MQTAITIKTYTMNSFIALTVCYAFLLSNLAGTFMMCGNTSRERDVDKKN